MNVGRRSLVRFFRPGTTELYLAQGSMTNEGLPSSVVPSPGVTVGFFNMAETSLSAALLMFDVSQPAPVAATVIATGFRNPYDLLFHCYRHGRLLTATRIPYAANATSARVRAT
jgi:hypothetical protein